MISKELYQKTDDEDEGNPLPKQSRPPRNALAELSKSEKFECKRRASHGGGRIAERCLGNNRQHGVTGADALPQYHIDLKQ